MVVKEAGCGWVVVCVVDGFRLVSVGFMSVAKG